MIDDNKEFHPVSNIFPLMDQDALQDLVDDIRENGLLEPIWLHPDGRIIDGRNRYLACLETGYTPQYRTWDGTGSLVAFVVSLNLHRRHLTAGQMAAVSVEIEPMLAEEAKKRQGSREDIQQKIAECDRGQARDQAAAITGANRQYVSDAKKLKAEAPVVFEALAGGKVNIPTAKELATLPTAEQEEVVAKGEKEILAKAKEIRAKKATEKRQERAEVAQAVKIETPEVFNVLYADPPWEYRNTGVAGAADEQYHTMPTDKIASFLDDIGLRVADNAVLFLWVTNPLLPDAMRVIEGWGFEYKTNFVWDKQRSNGTGFYLLAGHELLFVCTKGSFTPLTTKLPSSVIRSEAREHSRKPEGVYEIIEQLYPGCNCMELFARTKRDGWNCYGNETNKF